MSNMASIESQKPSQIRFYKPATPFYEFSNFYPASFELDGKIWSTTEHYFQAQKFPNFPEYQELIRTANTPNKAFKLAKQRPLTGYECTWTLNKGDKRLLKDIIAQYKSIVTIRSDWDLIKEDMMRRALIAKFQQNKKLRDLLISTADAELIEDSPRDSYWGCGKDGKGANRLGKLLEEVRNNFIYP